MRYGRSGIHFSKRRQNNLERFISDIDYEKSLERIAKHEKTSDTIIRYDINTTITKMLQEGKGLIAIEIELANKYPEYKEYIKKMVEHHNNKNISKNSKKEHGEER